MILTRNVKNKSKIRGDEMNEDTVISYNVRKVLTGDVRIDFDGCAQGGVKRYKMKSGNHVVDTIFEHFLPNGTCFYKCNAGYFNSLQQIAVDYMDQEQVEVVADQEEELSMNSKMQKFRDFWIEMYPMSSWKTPEDIIYGLMREMLIREVEEGELSSDAFEAAVSQLVEVLE